MGKTAAAPSEPTSKKSQRKQRVGKGRPDPQLEYGLARYSPAKHLKSIPADSEEDDDVEVLDAEDDDVDDCDYVDEDEDEEEEFGTDDIAF